MPEYSYILGARSSLVDASALLCLSVTPGGKGVHCVRKKIDYTARSRKGAKELILEDISREELKAKMERGEDFVLLEDISRSTKSSPRSILAFSSSLEALPEKSYRRSHLPGAINLPPGQTDQAEELIPRKETEVVV
jgi:hypothetical protein